MPLRPFTDIDVDNLKREISAKIADRNMIAALHRHVNELGRSPVWHDSAFWSRGQAQKAIPCLKQKHPEPAFCTEDNTPVRLYKIEFGPQWNRRTLLIATADGIRDTIVGSGAKIGGQPKLFYKDLFAWNTETRKWNVQPSFFPITTKASYQSEYDPPNDGDGSELQIGQGDVLSHDVGAHVAVETLRKSTPSNAVFRTNDWLSTSAADRSQSNLGYHSDRPLSNAAQPFQHPPEWRALSGTSRPSNLEETFRGARHPTDYASAFANSSTSELSNYYPAVQQEEISPASYTGQGRPQSPALTVNEVFQLQNFDPSTGTSES